MIRTIINTALTAAGCTKILYESDKLAGITTDDIAPGEIVGFVIEPNNVTIAVKGNGTSRTYAPHYIEILGQVKPEDLAENNETLLESLLDVAEAVVYRLVLSGSFKKIADIQAIKILESKYDANVTGWSLPITLNYLENKANC
jgi:hypothetical protein